MANPFKPGHDPRRNLRGRGKGQINLTDLVRKILNEPVSKTDKRTKLECLLRSTTKLAFEGDMKALDILLERGFGKMVQPVENTGTVPFITCTIPEGFWEKTREKGE